MILALDIGNTNITIGCYLGKELLFISRMATDRSRMEDQYAIELRDILDINGVSASGITGSIISSVVPPLTSYISRAVKKITSTDPLLVGPGIRTGLNIRIDNPATLGADLVAGCVAAMDRYPCPAIIIDMGTATTLSVLDAQKNMIGGLILPGVRISLDALCNRTSQLPQISLDAPQHVIGANTIESMAAGSVYGSAAMIDGLCDRVEAEVGAPCTVVATGGLAHQIVPCCRRTVLLDENLLLDGLRILYERNQ